MIGHPVHHLRPACIAVLFLAALLPCRIAAQTTLTLEHALEIAMENSPDIKQLELSLVRSQENLNAQNAALKSQFRLSLTPLDYSQDRSFNDFFSTWNTNETLQSFGTFTIAQPIKWTDGTIALINRFGWQDSYSEYQDVRSKTFSNNLYLSFQQPLFTYNRTMLALKELELDLEDTALRYATQKLALERNVAEFFYAVYQNRSDVQVAQAEYENQKISYDIIKNKVDAGLSAMEELYQAELNLLNSESALENRRVLLANSLDAFKRYVGISLFEEIDVLADPTHQPVVVDLQMALDHGLEHRMELRQREIDIENSQFNLIRTKALNEFEGNLSLSYGIIGTDEDFPDIYDTPTKTQKASLSFEIPLWDWGERKSRIKASEASIEMNEVNLEDEKNNIIISIRQVYRNLQNLENQVEIQRKNERNAQLTYDINLERYRNGDLTSMDLNLYQTQLSQAKTNLVRALIDYKIELLNMKIQSMYDFEKDCSVVPDLGLE